MVVYALTATLGGGVLAAGLCLIDPFDTGRFGAVTGAGMPHAGPRLVNASRGRDPQFDSAVIGNSHAQLIMPERLSVLTGHRFVTLTTPGTGPMEQLAMARWFVTHHRDRIGALVIGLDQMWCQPNGELAPPNPFPFWLYASDPFTYVSGLLKTDNLKHAWRRLALFAGLEPAARADGYEDYDQGRVWRIEEVEARLAEGSPWAVTGVTGKPSFPALTLLRAFLPSLPPGTALSLVFTPMHTRALPVPDSPGARLMAHCKEAVRALATDYGPAAVVDLLDRGTISDDTANFWDLTHYRAPVARIVEDGIATSLPVTRASAALR